ncbi:uncharacterized protein [Solanum lycopersicum]|uniref:uncharacterized protein n=1 Tax=Solanum lycopersicum TaxID=4081 RepID=UPI003748EFEA
MNITILLKHSGIWESEVKYNQYKSDGTVVGENISYMNLISAIATELNIDELKKNIIIRYIVEGNSSPMIIRNDMGVKLFIEIKKQEVGFSMYPLCINTTDKSTEELQIFDSSSGAIMCNESGQRDANALNVVESNIGDSCYIPEMEKENYISDTNISNVETKQLYKDKATLVAVMMKYKIKTSFNFRVKRSDTKSYVLECYSENCCWKLKASVRKNTDIFKVRYFNSEHACPLRDRVLSKVQATVGFTGAFTAPKLVNHKRKHTPNDIVDDVREMPLMRGFEFCRPVVVVVDGSHLSGAYKGTFVSASTLDRAGCILPLAYGIVDTENDCSWTLFFTQFKNAFGEREKMCVVSDRNESIIKSVSIVYPNVPHFACIWHLWKNVCTYYKRSKNTLSDLFYSMAKAYRKKDFEKLMAKVEKVDGRVKNYLEEAGYERWSQSHATVNRGRMMTSNIAECINGCLVDARQLPVLDLLEEARILFGSWNCKNREITSYTKETVGRKFEEILIINASKCLKMKVVASSEFIFSVYEGGIRYIVCLERKNCSCGRFQHDEIPCAHAMAVLKKKNIKDVHPYCSDYYKPDALANNYAVPMEPMPDKSDWIVPESVLEEVVLPPRYKKMPGRPRKKRKKNADEKLSGNTNCCGRCGQEGHNRRTCTFFPKDS